MRASALDLREHLKGGAFETAVGMAGEQRGDQVGVGRRTQRPVRERDLTAVGLRLLNELREIAGVGEVSVVRKGNAANGG